MLFEHGCQIAPSGYYAAKTRPPSARAIRDAELLVSIEAVFHDRTKGRGLAGARKVWPTWSGMALTAFVSDGRLQRFGAYALTLVEELDVEIWAELDPEFSEQGKALLVPGRPVV